MPACGALGYGQFEDALVSNSLLLLLVRHLLLVAMHLFLMFYLDAMV